MALGREHLRGFETKVARRVLLLFLLCAGLPVATLGTLGYVQVRKQLSAQAWERLTAESKNISMSIMERLLLLEADLRRPEDYVPRSTALLPNRSSRWLARGTGTLDGDFTVGPFLPESFVLEPEQRATLEDGGTVLIPPAADARPVVIVRREGEARAVRWGAVDPAYWAGAGQALGEGAALCVATLERRVLAGCTDGTRAALETLGAASSAATPGVPRLEVELEDGRHLGVRRELFLAGEFAGAPSWQVLVTEPEAAVLAPVHRFTRTLLMVMLLCVLLVGLSSEIQLKRTLGPVGRLKRATETVAAGDLDTRVAVHTGDEFEDLAHSFNSMVGRLGGVLDELDALNIGTIRALASAIDAKSHWTAGHSDRVTAVSLALGSELALSDEDLVLLERGAILHDVGKIGIPVAILDKPGPLSDEEFAVMKRHPTHGVRIVEPISQYAPLLPIIGQHHERWDGGGYPEGLAAEEIDPLARIAAVADGFDAMTSDRPYRSGLPIERALQIIGDERGRAYNPDVVDAFIALCSRAAASAAPISWLHEAGRGARRSETRPRERKTA